MEWIKAKDVHPGTYDKLLLCYTGKGYPLFIGKFRTGYGVVDVYTNQSKHVEQYVIIDTVPCD